jgi:adenine-specific DNA-methyltransferase
MARIDELLGRVSDAALRQDLIVAVAEVRNQARYGLVYEDHSPEAAFLRDYPLRPGDRVVHEQEDSSGIERVLAIDQDSITVEDQNGQRRLVSREDLIVVKPYGEPVYAGLRSVGRLTNGGPERPFHVVVNGENLHALQLLDYVCDGSVDCIYIDPPYNTGARDWKYNNDYVDRNDAWRHSRWLSFMEKRLQVASRLLAPDGVLIVTIDENEHAHLLLLLEQIFPAHSVTAVTIVHNPRGVQGDNFSYTHEYAVFVVPRGQKVIASRELEQAEITKGTSNLRNWGSESRREDARNCFYPIYVRDGRILGFGDVAPSDFHPDAPLTTTAEGNDAIWPLDDKGVERKWRYSREGVERIRHLLIIKTSRTGTPSIHLAKANAAYRTVWQSPKYDASVHGTQLVKNLIGTEFPFPKSLYAVYEALYAATANKPDALILDFFAGSGTTQHATFLLNSLDGGRRRCILVTNNEVDEKRDRELRKRNLGPGDPDYDANGIFQEVTRPRIEAAVSGRRPDGTPCSGEYAAGDRRAIADGFAENVEFFDLTYLDPTAIDLGLQYEAIAPALWLRAGAVGERDERADEAFSILASANYAVLFTETRFRAFLDELEKRSDVTHVYLVTDAPDAYSEMVSALPRQKITSMLYRDYLRNFKINVARTP